MSRETLRTVAAFLLIAAGQLGAGPRERRAAEFYVATDGRDAWSGTLAAPNAQKTDGPFASLARARDAVRRLKQGRRSAKPITVMISGGTYFLDETLVLTPQDSGTKECPVVYCAYPGEKPVLSGGKRITARWKPYKGDILVCSMPEAKEGSWIFRQLFVDGERQCRARIPNTGYYQKEKAIDKRAFVYEPGDFSRWENLNDVEVVVLHSWNESRLLVSQLDEAQRIVRFVDAKARHGINWSGATLNRYYIENVLDGLDRPGEWYLDVHKGELYYWPAGKIQDAAFIAPVLKQLVRFQGDSGQEQYVEHIEIRGLTFSDCDWTLPENGYPDCGDVGDIVAPSAITLDGARYCTLADNCIKNVGTYAIEVDGSGNRITGNEIFDVGGGGVISRNLGEASNVISYNHIHHCGVVYHSAVGVNIDDGGGIVSHNLIHDMPHSGVYARHWATKTQPLGRRNQEQGLIIEYNEIFNMSQVLDDSGGIFVRDSDILIRNNLIHDVYSQGRCPGWGIYLGCESRNSLVVNNVVYRTTESVHVWYKDRNITLENNVFVDGRRSQINYQNPRNLSHENIIFKRNIIYYSNPEAALFRVSGARSAPAESDYNVLFSPREAICHDSIVEGFPGVDTWEKWQETKFDLHSVVEDPLFVAPEKDDYSLKPGSPALKLGFEPIDLCQVGLRGKRPQTRRAISYGF